MLLIPAIDLKEGKCVRLRQGRMDDDTVFSDDPVAVAGKWVAAGAKRIHLVDLDGAFAGKPVNANIIKAIVAAFPDVPVQIGGGIRDEETIQAYLDAGVEYVIIGTKAVNEPHFVSNMALEYPRHIIVGLDAKDGKVAIDGWSKLSKHDVIDLAKHFEADGVEAIIYTDISRDGMMQGVNVEATARLARAIKIPVIASGGITNIDDIKALGAVAHEGIMGAITGRAIYEGTLDFAEAEKLAESYLCVMSLAKRIIPCLDVDNGRVVKGVKFVDIRDAGDPVEVARRYDREGADEITFLDITATHDNRDTIVHVVEQVASEVFIPLTVGGGIRTLDDIRRMLNAGADKVGINSAAVSNPEFVREAALRFGSQCIVVAMDAKKVSQPDEADRWEIFTHGGRKATGIEAIGWAKKMVEYGAGEILLTSMDRDGTREGFDLPLTRAISEAVTVPVIASGGVGNLDHLAEGVIEGKADAVLAASIFHFAEYTIQQAKEHMASRGIEMRL